MPTRDYPADERARAILEALDASGPATTAELAATLETHPVTIERRCRSLQRAGHVRQRTGGVYVRADADAASDSGDDSESESAAGVDGADSRPSRSLRTGTDGTRTSPAD